MESPDQLGWSAAPNGALPDGQGALQRVGLMLDRQDVIARDVATGANAPAKFSGAPEDLLLAYVESP